MTDPMQQLHHRRRGRGSGPVVCGSACDGIAIEDPALLLLLASRRTLPLEPRALSRVRASGGRAVRCRVCAGREVSPVGAVRPAFRT